jgi:hypothetical protein
VTRVLNDLQRHKVVSSLSGYYCIENKAQPKTKLNCNWNASDLPARPITHAHAAFVGWRSLRFWLTSRLK